MKKNNKIKKSVSMLAFLFVCAVSVILSSCSDELEHSAVVSFQGGDDACTKGHCAWTDR